MYQSRAYDDEHGEPVVVLVTTGTHDVSRLVQLLQGRLAVCEHIGVADRVLRQVRRHAGGRAALALLKAHGGPDFTGDVEHPASWADPATGRCYDLTRTYLDQAGDAWMVTGWLHRPSGVRIPAMSWETDNEDAFLDIPLPHVETSFGPLRPAEAEAVV
ncbi:phiSA1p31-related protein [Actinocrinis puniceicyclus]|uniref:PhiSA1p31-related protein n=1 Tax=Actinocrinis puniceicyclus TaxID=977794 RepID=A0A8J8BDB2_9ACTN|nr:phiSA1p31-related protein [Actinocrinis puniceicyclus]MBS2962619.1 phiSA1p31-related protein [Actinocrinis puniceicyclus]